LRLMLTNDGSYNKGNKQIRICALTLYPYDTSPGQRFRIEQWEPFLKDEGIEIDYYRFADEQLMKTMPQEGKFVSKIGGLVQAFARRLSHFSVLSKYDVIFIYRAAAMVGPAFLERLMTLYRRPIILDFDDSIFLTHTAESNKYLGWAKFAGKTATICRLSSSVIVGNSFLAEYAAKYNPHVTIIPSSVDIEKYQPRVRSPQNGRIIVGWTGSSTSQTNLESFAPMLRKLMESRDNIELHVHSDREPDLPGISYRWHRWSRETEVDIIASFDIGIMPIPDDLWSRGKCAMKALLYMSLGIPAICSNVGVNREVIKHGKNGFLAGTTEEWLESFDALVADEGLRRRLGDEARKTVVEHFSMKQCARLFADAIIRTVQREIAAESKK